MLNKIKAVFFTDTYKTSVTNTLKSEFASEDRVGIIVAKNEVESVLKNNLLDRIVPTDSNLRYKIRNTILPLQNIASSKIKKKPIPFINFNKGIENRIKNALFRYNPQIIFVTDHTILDYCIKAVTQLGKGTKIVVPIDEFTLDKRIVNKNVDLYFVDNMELKQALSNEGVAEDRIEIFDLPIDKKFFEPIAHDVAVKKLNMDTSKKNILISASCIGDERFKKLVNELSEASLEANFIFACGKNRSLLTLVRAKGFIGFNESLDMKLALTACDLVVTRPTTIFMQEAIAKRKEIFTIYPIDKIEQNNQNYLSVDKIKKFEDSKALIDAIRAFVTKEVVHQEDIIVKLTIDEDDEDGTYKSSVEKISESLVDESSAQKMIAKALELL